MMQDCFALWRTPVFYFLLSLRFAHGLNGQLNFVRIFDESIKDHICQGRIFHGLILSISWQPVNTYPRKRKANIQIKRPSS